MYKNLYDLCDVIFIIAFIKGINDDNHGREGFAKRYDRVDYQLFELILKRLVENGRPIVQKDGLY
jgi:hypothetical protein